ncbi:hypothetical protein LGK95_01435 [Clostridium algoriphilum]|uniref:hypothetical protein n=1 Tax=Clostridium algoriphilum TaxID=198347 RepID=UPI001CF3B4A3|nr:hypothetical protein [Clostridium algoriphilum]MCB2292199.1 hypothetical protein [Clostridium algoriphilum]
MNIKFNKEAFEELKALIKTKENSVIRLEVLAVGCGEPALALCLDKQRDDDFLVEVDGISFVTEEKFKIHFENTEILYNLEAFNGGFYVHRLHI